MDSANDLQERINREACSSCASSPDPAAGRPVDDGPCDEDLTDADRLLIADAAIENMRREMEDLGRRAIAAEQALEELQRKPPVEGRESDILLRVEAVEALRAIRRGWNAIGETGGVDGVEIKSGRNDPSGWNPRIYLPIYRKLEAPLRQLAAEWMARFIVAAEALCLDVIERGAAAIAKAATEPGR